VNVTLVSEKTFGVTRRTSKAVKGIRGESYPTFTGKVILEIRGQLPHVVWAVRCLRVYIYLLREVSRLRKSGPKMLSNL